MAGEKETPTTAGGAPAAGEGSGAPRLIAGKFKSVEEAVEKGYTGLEKGFHELTERVSGLTNVLERALTQPVGTVGVGERGASAADPYGRGSGGASGEGDDEIDAAEFIQRPGKILSAREKKFREAILREVGMEVKRAVAGASAVIEFKAQNPDLLDHEPVVTHFMSETNPNDPLPKRLKAAAKMTRDYLKSIRAAGEGDDEGEGAGRAPSGSEFVEGPAGERAEGSRKGAKKGGEGEPEDDEDLATYIADRRKQRQAHFRAPVSAGGSTK